MSSEQQPEQQLTPTQLPLADAPAEPTRCEDSCRMVVSRWTRYGKDHLYVTSPDGTRLGYWDLETELSHPTAPEYDSLLRCAAQGWVSPQETSPQRWPRVVNLFGGGYPSSGR